MHKCTHKKAEWENRGRMKVKTRSWTHIDIVFENGDSILEKMSHKKLFDAGRKKMYAIPTFC